MSDVILSPHSHSMVKFILITAGGVRGGRGGFCSSCPLLCLTNHPPLPQLAIFYSNLDKSISKGMSDRSYGFSFLPGSHLSYHKNSTFKNLCCNFYKYFVKNLTMRSFPMTKTKCDFCTKQYSV